jgi:hypothetical protein
MVGILGSATCGGAVRVEVLEDEVAQVVPQGGGTARVVPRATLPPEVREGDVVRGGQVDAEQGARLAQEVRAWRARLAVPAPVRLELDAGASESLTTRKEQ